MEAKEKMSFRDLLEESLKSPGKISEAFSIFHNYSLGNSLLAAQQLQAMELAITPINTFNAWKKLGVKINKGAKALSLLVPSSKSYTKEENGEETEHTITFFNLKKGWFAMSQTNADKKIADELSKPTNFDFDKALQELDITEVKFEEANGAIMGYAQRREIAINPFNPQKNQTRFHEMGHILLGHTKDAVMNDSVSLPRSIEELEAESVAYICISALGMQGSEESRGYIQNWFKGSEYPEKSAQRVLKVADQILKAGSIK